jgi:nucleolar complex protein 2
MSDIEDIDELNRLQELDPDFYAYLQENDEQLLSSIKEDRKLLQTTESATEAVVFTEETFEKLRKKASSDRCFKSFRALLSAFRAAARSTVGKDGESGKTGATVRIDDDQVFAALVQFILRESPGLLLHHAGSRRTGEKVAAATKFSRVRFLAHVYLGESLFLAQNTAATETVAAIFESLASETSIEFLGEEKKLKPLLFKVAVNAWANAETDETRRAVFGFIRNFVKGEKTAVLEPLYKRLVHSVALRLEKNPGRVAVLDEIGAQLNEVFRHNYDAAFKVAMISIRQLSIVLTTAMTEKNSGGSPAYNAVFSLSFLRSVRLWVRVVGDATEKQQKQFNSLVFPLASIILIAARAKEIHTVYAPFVAALADEVNHLMAASGRFIPISGILLKAIAVPAKRLAESKVGNISAAKMPNVETTAKLQEAMVKDNKTVLNQLLCLLARRLAEHLALLAQTVAFKEASYPILTELKRIIKAAPLSKSCLKPLIQTIDDTALLCERLRKQLKAPDASAAASGQLFALSEGNGAFTKLLDSSALVVASAGVFLPKQQGAKKAVAAADLKAVVAAEEAQLSGKSKRSLKRQRQAEKRKDKDAKRRRKNDDQKDLVEMVLSDDE